MGGGQVGEGQGEWERRSEAFVKIKKKIIFFWGGGVWLGGGGASGWGGVRVDVNREVNFCENSKKNFEGGGMG